jgi:hypothetical protein
VVDHRLPLKITTYGSVSIAVIGASWWWWRQRRLRAARRARLAGLVRIALLPNERGWQDYINYKRCQKGHIGAPDVMSTVRQM